MLKGTVLQGRYQLGEVLCWGGMCLLQLATDLKKNAVVVVKVPRDTHFNRYLQNEIDVYQRIGSIQGVPSLVDSFELDEKPLLVLSYHPGKNLEQMLDDSALGFYEATKLVADVCAIIGRIHSRGFVHRDLKPSNIITNSLLRPSVVDFGTSTLINEIEQPGAGTPSYMSPEACRCDPVDERSDIYSLGCIWYECLTGKLAFDGDSKDEILLAQLSQPPPKLPMSTPCRRGATKLLHRMLAKHPCLRPNSTTDVVREMETIIDRSFL